MRRINVEPRKERIENKLKVIIDLYNMILKEPKSDLKDFSELNKELNCVASEICLIQNCRIIAGEIKFLNKKSKEDPMNQIYASTAARLKVVFDQLVELIRDEYRTIRTRNDKIPQLDILEF